MLHDTPARALTFIDRLPLEDGCEGYVIQGRCANFAFQGRDDVVSVFLTANDAFCVDTVADTHGVSARKAKTVVRETNDNRKTYHKYYTGQEWGLSLIHISREAKERAEEQLRQKQSIQEYYHSRASLARAMKRLKATSGK